MPPRMSFSRFSFLACIYLSAFPLVEVLRVCKLRVCKVAELAKSDVAVVKPLVSGSTSKTIIKNWVDKRIRVRNRIGRIRNSPNPSNE